MKKNSILATVASAAISMALSFTLIACGDDSPTSPETSVSGGESSSDVNLSSGGDNPASSGGAAGQSSGGDVGLSSAIAPESSATAGSSSSVANPHQAARGVAAECRNGLDKGVTMDVVEETEIVDGPGGTPPVAYMYDNGDGSVTYVIEEMMLNCGAEIQGIDVSAEGDTLFAQLEIDPNSVMARCICRTRITFKIEKDSQFTSTTKLVIDDDRSNVYRIIPGTYDDVSSDKEIY